jgi:Protein of unknown function (DUF3467)
MKGPPKMSDTTVPEATTHPPGDADQEIKMDEVTLRIPYAETYIYSNVAAFSLSQMDIRISFAEAMPDRTAKARVGIVMAPEHAALLGIALIQQVHAFESAFGPIRLPQWQSQKQEAIRRLLEAGMIHSNPKATGPEPAPPQAE